MTHVYGKPSISSLMLALTISLLVGGMVGCSESDQTGTVKGTVMLGEEPLADASIILVSLDTGQGGSAELQADGTFSIEQPIPVGSYTVYFAPKADPNMEERMQQGLPPVPVEMNKNVPEKYLNEAASDLKVQVEAGENDVTLQLLND